MGSKSKSSSSQATTTKIHENNLALEDVAIGEDLVFNATSIEGSNNTVTDYGAVAAGIEVAQDTVAAVIEGAGQTIAQALNAAQESQQSAMQMVDNMARDPQNDTTIFKYGYGVAALAIAAYVFGGKRK